MKKIIILSIFLLAFILRFFHLGQNPPSLDWDEASLGYNAFSLLKTGRDEYGEFLPLSIRSFGDYKPPLYTYLSIPFVAIFGLNEFSVRFISALFGTLTTLVVYLLVKKIFPGKSYIFYLLSFIFFALSPWHIQFSRIAFEANLALFWFIFGIYLLFKGLEKGPFLFIASFSFALSMYSYHSPRLLVPFLLVGFSLIFRKSIKQNLAWAAVGAITIILLILPIIYQLTSTSARLGSVTLFNPYERLGSSIRDLEYDMKRNDNFGKILHNRRLIYAKEAFAGYLDHFNFDFLFLIGDPPGRHHAAGMGMLYLWDFPFIILGLVYFLKHRDKSVSFLFLWFLISPLASAITTGTPHAVRAIFYLPTYQIFSAAGVIFFLTWIKNLNKNIRYFIFIFYLLSFIFNFYYYLRMYYIHTPVEYSSWWQYGYKQVVEEVSKRQNQYDKIIVTYKYDQPYIFFLFYQKFDPSVYQKKWSESKIERSVRSYGKYEFRNIEWSKDSQSPNTLIVGTPDEIPEDISTLKEIKFLDGTPAFKIVGT